MDKMRAQDWRINMLHLDVNKKIGKNKIISM